MATEPNPMLGLCKAQMLALLEAHRHWVEDLQCLRQVQLRTDEGLLEADRTFGAELASAPDFNAVLNSQLAFINRQLAMQHRIWQGWMQIGARGPAVWAEQYQGAQMAWQHVFSDSAAATSSASAESGWQAWGDVTRSAMDALSAMSSEANRAVAQQLAWLQGSAAAGRAKVKPARAGRAANSEG